jgi:hypothetical protein
MADPAPDMSLQLNSVKDAITLIRLPVETFKVISTPAASSVAIHAYLQWCVAVVHGSDDRVHGERSVHTPALVCHQ